MGKRFIVELVCISLILSVAGAGICAQTAQSKTEPAKQGWMDRMKSAINDFKNRGQKQAAPTATPQQVKKAEPAKAPAQPQPVKVPKTKEEMISSITNNVERIDVIAKMIPGIKVEKGSDGKVSCLFNGKKLEALSNEDLTKLYKSVSQIAVQYRTERMQNQIQSIEQAQQAVRTESAAARAGGVTTVPNVPQVPSTPANVAATPRGAVTPPTSVTTVPNVPQVPKMIGPAGAAAPATVKTPPAAVSTPPARPGVPPAPPTRR